MDGGVNCILASGFGVAQGGYLRLKRELTDREGCSMIFFDCEWKIEMNDLPVQFELRDKRVFVAGHTGMVGSALIRRLGLEGCEILTAKRPDFDLRRCEQVDRWMAEMRPDAVFLAAGKVGGIHANSTYPADFIADNLAIALNVIHSAHESGVQKLLFLGSYLSRLPKRCC